MRAWLKKMITAVKFVELVAAVLSLHRADARHQHRADQQLAHLRRARPRSETLERLRAPAGPAARTGSRQRRPPCGRTTSTNEEGVVRGDIPARSAPAHLPRVPVFNRVPPELRVCPQCGAEMTTVGHSSCEVLNVVPARIVVEERLDETVACPKDDTSSRPRPRRRSSSEASSATRSSSKRSVTSTSSTCRSSDSALASPAPVCRHRAADARTKRVAAIDLLAPVAAIIHEQTRGPGLLGTDATGIPVLDPARPKAFARHDLGLDQRALGDLLLLAHRRLRER